MKNQKIKVLIKIINIKSNSLLNNKIKIGKRIRNKIVGLWAVDIDLGSEGNILFI